jgi:uncharacterized cupin superfamily protein
MPIEHVIITGADDVAARTESTGTFAYEKRLVVPKPGNPVQVSFMEIPPGRSAYPYHWHELATEVYVVLSGRGILRTPEGEREIVAGQVVVMPAGIVGAHRLHNPSTTEPLRYVDIDTVSRLDVVHYPDSGKTATSLDDGGVMIVRDTDAVGYYDDEPDAHD